MCTFGHSVIKKMTVQCLAIQALQAAQVQIKGN